jgi:hypothetical protein
VLHAISFLPVMVLGAAFMLHDGLTLSRVRALADGGLDDGAPPRGEQVPVGAADQAESLQ